MDAEVAYSLLLRAAVRYFALYDKSAIAVVALEVREVDLDLLWPEFWWRHRSSALVAGALVEAHAKGLVALSPKLCERCDALLRATQARYAALQNAAMRASEALSAVRIPHRFTKGIVLTGMVYPVPAGCATRLFSDIDIGLDHLDSVRARAALLTAGFSHYEGKDDHWTVVWPSQTSLWEGLPLLETGDTAVDPKVMSFGCHHVFVELHTGKFVGRGFLREPMALEDDSLESHLLHACLHLMKHATNPKAGTHSHSVGLIDIVLILNHPTFDASRFSLMVGTGELRTLVAIPLGMCAGAFDVDILPEGVRWVFKASGFRTGFGMGAKLSTGHLNFFWDGVRIMSVVPELWGSLLHAIFWTATIFVLPLDTRRRKVIRWLYHRTIRPLLKKGPLCEKP